MSSEGALRSMRAVVLGRILKGPLKGLVSKKNQ